MHDRRGEDDAPFAYHERTKHFPFRFAASLGYMDWDTQPDPFRRFVGARSFELDLVSLSSGPRYEPAFVLGHVDPVPLDAMSLAQLFQDALGLSAWKEAAGNRWALRVNPSSGNLHPTEGYLICGPEDGLHDRPAVYHYAPLTHCLELRTELSAEAWRSIARQLPEHALLVGLTSIHWRESWKYGERAFRYCQHDVGHAIACIAVAAAALGWEAKLLEGVTDDELAALLGVRSQTGAEAEHADCLLALFPQVPASSALMQESFALDADLVSELSSAAWMGQANTLSHDHHDWPAIDAVARATRKCAAPDARFWSTDAYANDSLQIGESPISLRAMIHKRRSAVAFDGRTGITCDTFYQILVKAMPGARQIPFTTLPWRPCVDLLLFVHRVRGLAPGLYALVRDPARKESLQAAMDRAFTWSRQVGCPSSLPLYLLSEGDARHAAQQTSCDQAIAADGAFAVALLAEYRPALEALGPWFYRRLFWETGVVGQVLYLEAEASGIRGTGIGCFFDDLTHRLFGLEGDRFQVLYHFTMGGAVDDPRLQTHPPYQHLGRRGEAISPSTEKKQPLP
jgi:SagB-type dehydrogenase family enzyme